MIDVSQLVHSIPLVSVGEQNERMDRFMSMEITLYLLQNFGVFVNPDTVYLCIDSFRKTGNKSKYIYRIVLRYIAEKLGIDIWGMVSYQLYKYYLDKDVFKLCEERLRREIEVYKK